VQSILLATQRSFAAMKRRLGSKTPTGIFYMERPFFDVDVELKVRRKCKSASTVFKTQPTACF
jgi:dynein heavy chain